MQVLTLVFIPISPKIFRAINRFFANYYWGFLVFMIERVSRIRVDIIGDDVPIKENAVVDCNHQNVSDIPLLMVLAWRKKRLGDLKFFAKDAVKYIPGPGWGMFFLDCLYVKRNWLSDRQKIDSTFKKFRTHKIPIWIVSFLEGTRITPEKLAHSQSFMKRRGLPITNNVMAPRTKGFIASVTSLRSELQAVYNLTLHYPSGIPNLWQLFNGDCKEVTIHVKRTAIEDIPEADSDLESWIQNEYLAKDRLIDKLNLESNTLSYT